MADTLESTSTSSDANAAIPSSAAANQARLRKERREAKIRSGGSARLSKITGLGGVRRDFTSPASPSPTQVYPDPDEVDISSTRGAAATAQRHGSTPPPTSSGAAPTRLNEAALHQMMRGLQSSAAAPDLTGSGLGATGTVPSSPPPGLDDPMMKMFQQMISGNAGDGIGGLPSFPGMDAPAPATTTSPHAYLWRVIHALFALSLGLFVALTTQITGTQLERERSSLGYASFDSELLTSRSQPFFYIFLVVEMLLLSSRFLLDKEDVRPDGIIGIVMGFLSEPLKRYVLLALRYFSIWTTVSRDAMVCIFVVGVYVWVKDGTNQ
ncbi:hypothetical protein K3495_g4955 [Podosphaera aphanis]|nr:hypothetical protein K3495_g4955 [Podosphaera aphanis]